MIVKQINETEISGKKRWSSSMTMTKSTEMISDCKLIEKKNENRGSVNVEDDDDRKGREPRCVEERPAADENK